MIFYKHEYGDSKSPINMAFYSLDYISDESKVDYNKLQQKIIISVYDPLFSFVTGGSSPGGELILKDGRSTGKYHRFYGLNIPRALGITRTIPIQPLILNGKQFGYIPLIDESVSIGLKPVFLSDLEKRFYNQFVLTEFEPNQENLDPFFY